MKRILALVLIASLFLACQNPFSADEKSTLRTGSFELRVGEGYSFTDSKLFDITCAGRGPQLWPDICLFGQIQEGTGDIAPYGGNWLDAVLVAQYVDAPGTSTIVREISTGCIMSTDSVRVVISLPKSYFLLCQDNVHFAKITIQEQLFFLDSLNRRYLDGFVIGYIYQKQAGNHTLEP